MLSKTSCSNRYGVFTLLNTETDTKPDKNRLYGGVHTERDSRTDSHWILCTCYRYLSWSRSRSRAV